MRFVAFLNLQQTAPSTFDTGFVMCSAFVALCMTYTQSMQAESFVYTCHGQMPMDLQQCFLPEDSPFLAKRSW